MKPTVRFPKPKFILTVSFVVIAAVGFAAAILLLQDNPGEGWYRMAAELGHAEAQYNLGVMYATGEGVHEDDAEAARWYRRAAEQGNAEAQFHLGEAYLSGLGVPKDVDEATRWYRKAAEQGDARTQYALGALYYTIDMDLAERVRWLRKAAEQGHADAQWSLAVRYATGMGVRRNSMLAHMWYNIAGANGRKYASGNRDIIERDMTRAEIRRATELARACINSDYQDCEP